MFVWLAYSFNRSLKTSTQYASKFLLISPWKKTWECNNHTFQALPIRMLMNRSPNFIVSSPSKLKSIEKIRPGFIEWVVFFIVSMCQQGSSSQSLAIAFQQRIKEICDNSSSKLFNYLYPKLEPLKLDKLQESPILKSSKTKWMK